MSDDINFYSNEVHHGDVKVYGDQIRLGCGSNVTTNGPCISICGNQVYLSGNYTYIYGEQGLQIGSSSSLANVSLCASCFTYNCKEVATKCYVDDCVAANMGGSGNVDSCCFLQLNCSSFECSSQTLNYGSFVVKDYMGVCGSMVVCGAATVKSMSVCRDMNVNEYINVCGCAFFCGEAFFCGGMVLTGQEGVYADHSKNNVCFNLNTKLLDSVKISGYDGNGRYCEYYPVYSERSIDCSYSACRVRAVMALSSINYSCLATNDCIADDILYFVYPD